ncbi:uncharacterized protein LOC111622509 isoform X1 [Centruroides sculpturatus]|uniref:uncharacterized protein LOC111622509 isoform X1 n=2 Tax=Centruroides sculpturatus TaxID=218467 RepID=UPI000C6DFE51|nr:uncharacterized protein LOC111622509 isoform X1 [Centruroides sculpturatus]
MENILKSVSCQSLDLTNENLPKPVVVKNLKGQIGNQYYVFTDEEKLKFRKSKPKKQIDSEDEEEEKEEKLSKDERSLSILSKPSISRVNDFIIVSVLFVVICIITAINIFSKMIYHEETIGQSSFNLNIIDILLLLAIAIASCFGFLIYYNGYISDGDLLKKTSKLKKKYAEMNSFEHHNLWYDSSCDIPFEKYVINLKVVEDKMVENSLRNEIFLLEDIFTIKRISSQKQFILVTGKPFFGKTTLVRRLAYDWSTRKSLHYLSRYDILIVIQLRELGNRTIIEAITETILGTRDENSINAFVKSKLNFLILLDGYDNMVKKQLFLDFLRSSINNPSPKMTVVLTSNEKVSKTIRIKFDWHFSLTGLMQEDQISYVAQVFVDDVKKGKRMKEIYLENLVFLEDLTICPQMMNILCSIHKHEEEFNVTITTLYIKIIEMLIRRYWSKYGYNYLLKKSSFVEGEKLLLRLGKIIFENLINDKHFVLEKDLKKEFSNEQEFEIISQLNIVPVTNFGDDIAISTFHQMLIEFLAAFYVFNLEYKNNKYSVEVYGITVIKGYFKNFLRFIFLYGMQTFWDFDRLERDLTEGENLYNMKRTRIIQFPGDLEIFQICRDKISEERFAKFCMIKADITYNIEWDSVSTLREVLSRNQVELVTIFLPTNKEKWKRVQRDVVLLLKSNPSIRYVCFQLNSCPCYIDEHKHVFVDLRSLLEAAISAIDIESTVIVEIEHKFRDFKKISRNFRSEDFYREEEIVSLVYFALNQINQPPFSVKLGKIHLQFRQKIELEMAREMILFVSEKQIETYSKYSWWQDLLMNTLNWVEHQPRHYTLQIDDHEIISIL